MRETVLFKDESIEVSVTEKGSISYAYNDPSAAMHDLFGYICNLETNTKLAKKEREELAAQLELVTLQRDVIVLNWGSRDGQVMAVMDGDDVVAVVWPEMQSASQQLVRMPTKTNLPSVARIKAQALRDAAYNLDYLENDSRFYILRTRLITEAARIEKEAEK